MKTAVRIFVLALMTGAALGAGAGQAKAYGLLVAVGGPQAAVVRVSGGAVHVQAPATAPQDVEPAAGQ